MGNNPVVAKSSENSNLLLPSSSCPDLFSPDFVALVKLDKK